MNYTDKPSWQCLERNCRRPHGEGAPGKHRCPRCKELKRKRSKRERMRIVFQRKPCATPGCGNSVASWSMSGLCKRCYDRLAQPPEPCQPAGYTPSAPGRAWMGAGDD